MFVSRVVTNDNNNQSMMGANVLSHNNQNQLYFQLEDHIISGFRLSPLILSWFRMKNNNQTKEPSQPTETPPKSPTISIEFVKNIYKSPSSPPTAATQAQASPPAQILSIISKSDSSKTPTKNYNDTNNDSFFKTSDANNYYILTPEQNNNNNNNQQITNNNNNNLLNNDDLTLIDFSLTKMTPNRFPSLNMNSNNNADSIYLSQIQQQQDQTEEQQDPATMIIWTPSLIQDLPSRELQPLNLEQNELVPLEKSDLFRYRQSLIKFDLNDDIGAIYDNANVVNQQQAAAMVDGGLQENKMKIFMKRQQQQQQQPLLPPATKYLKPIFLIKKQSLLPCDHLLDPKQRQQQQQQQQGQQGQELTMSQSESDCKSLIIRDLPSVSIISLRLNNNDLNNNKSKWQQRILSWKELDDDQLFAYKRPIPVMIDNNKNNAIIKQILIEAPVKTMYKSTGVGGADVMRKKFNRQQQQMKKIRRKSSKLSPQLLLNKRQKSKLSKDRAGGHRGHRKRRTTSSKKPKTKTKTRKKQLKNSPRKKLSSRSSPPPPTTAAAARKLSQSPKPLRQQQLSPKRRKRLSQSPPPRKRLSQTPPPLRRSSPRKRLSQSSPRKRISQSPTRKKGLSRGLSPPKLPLSPPQKLSTIIIITPNEQKSSLLWTKKKSRPKFLQKKSLKKKSPLKQQQQQQLINNNDNNKTKLITNSNTVRWTSEKFQPKSAKHSPNSYKSRKTSKFYQSPTNYPDY
ncbi:hypothetical protein DERP_007883 [Dermatophagoides pteronyssinus]|uniref:Uncharacterized protein n=1 Tax=Dermatophagoides pteronyssinus TaxID=6956 RepID=A0ABQ8ISV5_DERPT|nr:hypothetical protein DERP_007883 [Dermatophagoides pteronyssinus]